MNSVERLARKFAEMHNANRNPPSTAPRVGTVVSISPIKIQYGENILLDSRHLIIADHVMNGYKREVELTDVQMVALEDDFPATIEFHLTGSPPSNSYRITKLTIPKTDLPTPDNKLFATIQFTDGLSEGDKVILIPDSELKLWFVVDRVWKETES